ncbi:MAG: TonB-dependent siderophore receptor [Pseudomonadota bacterium]
MQRYFLGTISAFALITGSHSAAAQSASPDIAGEEEDPTWKQDVIIVTGDQSPYTSNAASVTRLPVPLFETPQSIQVLPRTLIDEQELNTLSDALLNVSGAVPNGPAETVLVNPIIRGLEAEIYVDGLIGYGDTAVVDPSSLVAVERVEVAKGPTSTLFGGGTGAPVGGLINVVTKTPKEDAFAKFGLRAGSFSTVAPNVDLNLPIGERAGIRFAGEYFASDDFIDEVEIDRITLAPSLGVEVTDATEFLLRVGYNRIEQLEFSGLPAEIAGLDGIDEEQFVGAPDGQPRTTIENVSVHGTLTHQFTDQLSGQIQSRYFRNEFDEFASFPLLGPGAIVDGSTFIFTSQLPVETNQFTVDGSLTGEFQTGPFEHVLLGGITYDTVDYEAGIGFNFNPVGIFDFFGENDLAFGPVPPLDTLAENDYRTFAFYLQDQISLTDRVHIQAGARYSRYRFIEVVGGQGTDETFDEFDPRIGVTVEVVPGLALFGGYAQGSRLSIFFVGTNGVPPELETSESFEAGLKFDLDRLGLSGTLAAFRNDRENVPTPSPDDPFTSIQTGEQRGQGVELDLVWEPITQLSVLLTSAYTDAEVIDDTAIPIGDGLPRVPRYSGRLAARYRFDEGLLDGFGVGAGLTWQSDAELTRPNSFISDDFVLVDAQASYQFDRYRIGVTVQNIFGEDAFQPFQFLAQPVVRPVQPRSAFVTLSAEF